MTELIEKQVCSLWFGDTFRTYWSALNQCKGIPPSKLCRTMHNDCAECFGSTTKVQEIPGMKTSKYLKKIKILQFKMWIEWNTSNNTSKGMPGSLNNFPFIQRLGPETLATAFVWARFLVGGVSWASSVIGSSALLTGTASSIVGVAGNGARACHLISTA